MNLFSIVYILFFSTYSYYLLKSGFQDINNKKRTMPKLRTFSIFFSGIMFMINLVVTLRELNELSIPGLIILPLFTVSFLIIMIFDSKTLFD